MSKYIGTKAVNLSTTSADVTGNADIDGNLTVGGDLTVSGTTITVDHATAQTVDLGDNDKIRLGDGNDLQIYHDGQHSIIQDAGTGDLRLYGNNVKIKNADNTAAYIQGINGAEVNLYYNNALKLATTSTGVDITGQVDVNSAARIDSNGIVKAASGTEAAPTHSFLNDPDNGMFRATTNTIGFSTGGSEAMRINSSGNVTVGTQDDAVWNDTTGDGGINLRSDGILAAARNGGEPLLLNRIGTEGELIKFKKNGADVGTITTTSGDLGIGQDNAYLFFDGGGNKIVPASTNTGGASNGVMSLGAVDRKFVDVWAYDRVMAEGGTAPILKVRDGAYSNGFWMTQSFTEGAAIINNNAAIPLQIKSSNSTNNNYISFFTKGASNERIRFEPGGAITIREDGAASVSGTSTQPIQFRVTQSNNQSALMGSIHGGSRSSWGGDLVFKTKDSNGTPNDSLTERMRILAGGGITFNGDTAAANALDDYEEGVFSASMVPSTSGTITLNGGVFKLAYTKIGRKVHIQGLLETTSRSSPVGRVEIRNLPFTAVDGEQYTGRCGAGMRITNVEGTGFGVGDVYSWYILEGGTTIYVDIDASTVQPSSYSQFYISLSYNTT